MAPYWSPASAAPGAAGRARRASSAGSSSGATATVLGRKTSSAGEAYHRVVTATSSSTRNPLYGMHGLGLADSVAGSASDDTSASSASASRHYVDPWDLENFMYLKRHWAAEDAEGEASSTPALETAAQSDFYYVGPGVNGEVELDVVDMPAYRPDSVLLADEPLSLSVAHAHAGHALLNAVEEESFFNERYDPARHHRLVRRSHSSAATYLHHHREEPRAASAAAAASMASMAARNAAYNGRRRSVACAPRYYRTPITGGDSSGEYEAFEDYADELSRRLGAVDLEPPAPTPAPVHPRSKRHSIAGKLPPSQQMPRSRASIAGPAPVMASRLLAGAPPPQPVRRRHSHCVGWPAPGAAPAPAPAPAHIYSTRRASFSRGQLLAGLHAVHPGRHATELAYGTAYGAGGGSSDDCYVSDASEDLTYGEGPGGGSGGSGGSVAGQQAGRRDAVVDGFTDADMVYAQLASSLYADSAYGYGYCGYGPASSADCSRFQLTNYGHLKIDYSCSWRSLDHYIAHS